VIPTLHVVTDDEILRREDFLAKAILVLAAGGADLALHLRGPETAGRVLQRLAEPLRDRARTVGSRLLANDRVDLAFGLRLSGAHLGQRSLPPVDARSILGPGRLLGLSVHGPEEVDRGAEGALDFLFVGTIFTSSSHPGRHPGGPERIREIRGLTDLPLLAIGGIDLRRVSEVLEAGAHGVAVLGGVWNARDPEDAVRGYLSELVGD
jgi:thiamine-phosphate diphosphorylase